VTASRPTPAGFAPLPDERLAAEPLATDAFRELVIGPPPADEIRRHLGYPAHAAPRARISARVDAVAAEAVAALRPRGVYAVHSVAARSPRRIVVGEVVIRGQVARFVGPVDRVAVVVATAGPGISELADRYAREGDSLGAWIVDAVGSWAAEAAADAVCDRLRAYAAPGEELTLRYSPGYCGMSMTQQAVLFDLVQAHAAGVKLLPSMLMQPLKSVSGIVGIGPVGERGAVVSSPCEACHRLGCHMRR
jgi:hypothetical protein